MWNIYFLFFWATETISKTWNSKRHSDAAQNMSKRVHGHKNIYDIFEAYDISYLWHIFVTYFEHFYLGSSTKALPVKPPGYPNESPTMGRWIEKCHGFFLALIAISPGYPCFIWRYPFFSGIFWVKGHLQFSGIAIFDLSPRFFPEKKRRIQTFPPGHFILQQVTLETRSFRGPVFHIPAKTHGYPTILSQ